MKQPARGEFEIIAQLKKRCSTSSTVRIGIGDDCAMLQLPPGEVLLTTTDMLMEGVHFRRDWTDLLALGRKAASVNLSDLAAMGGTPRALLLALAIPPNLGDADLDLFLTGFLDVCHASQAVLAGGDTCASQAGLSICVTALGSAAASDVIQRSGAKPGDHIYVTGCLGDSALALHWLIQGRTVPPALLSRHLDPTARIATGQALAKAGIPSAMIDVSDGLLADLGHILELSQVGAHIEVSSLPLSAEFRTALAADHSLLDQALAGGEDYELLFTADPAAEQKIAGLAQADALPICRIGVISAIAQELELVFDGNPYPLPVIKGYKHFSDR